MNTELNPADEFYFQWHITERCNKHCQHCYQSENPMKELPLPDLESALDIMDEALIKWGKLGSLSLTGGEPFMRREVLFALMDKIDQLDSFAYYDILTNGSLISDATIEGLKKKRKLRRIQVSLEGATEEINDSIRGSGSYEETMNAIRKLKNAGLAVSVMTTISRSNYSDILDLIDLLEKERVDTFALERLIPEGRGEQLRNQILSAEELQKLYEKVYDIALQKKEPRILMYRPLFDLVAPDDPHVGALCSAGNNALTIMPDGSVYPCRRLPISIGNILIDGLFKIWYNSDTLWDIRNPSNLKGKCRNCELLPNCRGCRAMAYFCTGDYMEEDPQCWKS